MELKPRIAVVTGVSRQNGIGAAICRELARRGLTLFFTHWVPFDRATSLEAEGGPEDVAADLRRLGATAVHKSLDLTVPGAWSTLLPTVEQELGSPDILVNNAAHWEASNFTSLAPAILEAHVAVNVSATLIISVVFARAAAERGWGRIVSLVSGQDRSGEVNNLAYGATKGAVSAFTRYLALEVAAQGVSVNAVDPGPTDTGWMAEDLKEDLLARHPSGRLGRPEDAARLVGFLVSEEAQWITGQVLHSDGGFTG